MEEPTSQDKIIPAPTHKRSRVDLDERTLLRDEIESLKSIVETLTKKISHLESQLAASSTKETCGVVSRFKCF
jgi:uncharacterized protein YlxW (UPF0749 family)